MMLETVTKLEKHICMMESYFVNNSETTIAFKPFSDKWSKKEILGHLIDSGIYNYQRFSAIQIEDKPYKIVHYNQDKLVLINDYQNANIYELIGFWLSVNRRIIRIMQLQTKESLKFEILIDNSTKDLEFLIKDYVEHMKHHINQIVK